MVPDVVAVVAVVVVVAVVDNKSFAQMAYMYRLSL